MEAPHKKQRQKPQNPQKKEADADGDDVPEPVQTVTKEMLQETTYEVKDGLRRVKPYFYTYHVFAKGRWFGKPLIDILTSDYKTYSREYNARAIANGRVKLSGKIVTPQAIVKQHAEITHTVHRHEPPVIGTPVKIVMQTDDMVAIDKPPSIPVHPTGRYRHNTVIMLLAKEHGLLDLHPVHRLDRLTSGLLLFARNAAAAERISSMIRSHQVQKTYLARVEGVFPHEHIDVDQPIRVVNFHLGVCEVSPQGKPSFTEVRRISTSGKSSLVMCLPKTGRTHQIRVHLAHLGFPIMHDPVYGSNPKAGIPRPGTSVQVPAAAKKDETKQAEAVESVSDSLLGDVIAEVAKEALKGAKEELAIAPAAALEPGHPAPLTADAPPQKKSRTETDELPESYCPECTQPLPDPTPDELSLFLHALSYEGEGWKYATEKPYWAADSFAL